MNSRIKPPELLQAQIAGYADTLDLGYRDHRHIIDNIGFIAAGDVVDVVHTDRVGDWITTPDGQKRVEADTERTIATAAGYADYLRNASPEDRQLVGRRAELLRNYDDFKPALQAKLAEINDLEERQTHKDFLGAASNESAFGFEREGKEYVVRLVNHKAGTQPGPMAIEQRVAASVLIEGRPHYEQAVAASYEDGVFISKRMPGQDLSKATPERLSHVTDEQLSTFIDTIIDGRNHSVVIDTTRPSNVMYDVKAGFGVVDVGKQGGYAPSIDQIVASVGRTMFGKAGTESGLSTAELHATRDNLLTRFRDVYANRLQGEERERALTVYNTTNPGIGEPYKEDVPFAHKSNYEDDPEFV